MYFIYCILLALFLFPNYIKSQEPPFEKIYVTCNEIVTTPQGIFCLGAKGEYYPVRLIRSDCGGTYAIRTTSQNPIKCCPSCGYRYQIQKSIDTPLRTYPNFPLGSREKSDPEIDFFSAS